MAYTTEMREDGIWQITIDGQFNDDEMALFVEEFIEVLESKPEPNSVNLLVDVRNIGKVSPAIRKMLKDLQLGERYPQLGRTAVWGNSRFVKVLIDFILKAASQEDDMQFFNGSDEALAWLENPI